jgi:3-isopropylmalate/(R)-2-methylmalate dehydratase small subunit
MAEAFKTLTAVAVPYDARDVDTDQIIPARFLKVPRDEGYGRYLFHDLRFREDGSEVTAFVLNRAAYRGARIFVANTNFGCGSSREGAPYAFYDSGFRSVIAPSFGDIFFSNCLKNGIVPVRLPDEVCATLRDELKAKPGTPITVDLESQRVNGTHGFTIDPFYREMLLQGVDEIGLTQSLTAKIEAFEKDYGRAMPWAVR